MRLPVPRKELPLQDTNTSEKKLCAGSPFTVRWDTYALNNPRYTQVQHYAAKRVNVHNGQLHALSAQDQVQQYQDWK
ncbi:hypothetical protein RB195_022862 [Necator americanus]|uniref:Uncharacterized protein n=1 Tax=Necator americanus TaxID=51031 RepID=A0ABR1EGV0_NECAM